MSGGNPPHCFRCGGMWCKPFCSHLGCILGVHAAMMVPARPTLCFFCFAPRLICRALWSFLEIFLFPRVIRRIASDVAYCCVSRFVAILGASWAFLRRLEALLARTSVERSSCAIPFHRLSILFYAVLYFRRGDIEHVTSCLNQLRGSRKKRPQPSKHT